MSEFYRHRQIGYLTVVLVIALCILIALIMYIEGLNWVALAVLAILAVSLVFFSSLTVVIDQDTLEIRFGAGIVRKRFRLSDIESCGRVRNPWYYGWGIRSIPHGWLFSVSGLDAVEIVMKTGKTYRIGTDEPEALEAAIRRAIVH